MSSDAELGVLSRPDKGKQTLHPSTSSSESRSESSDSSSESSTLAVPPVQERPSPDAEMRMPGPSSDVPSALPTTPPRPDESSTRDRVEWDLDFGPDADADKREEAKEKWRIRFLVAEEHRRTEQEEAEREAGTSDFVTVVIEGAQGDKKKFKMGKIRPLGRLFVAWCKHANVDIDSSRFLHDGVRLDPDRCPADYDLEDNDIINCLAEQTGGAKRKPSSSWAHDGHKWSLKSMNDNYDSGSETTDSSIDLNLDLRNPVFRTSATKPANRVRYVLANAESPPTSPYIMPRHAARTPLKFNPYRIPKPVVVDRANQGATIERATTVLQKEGTVKIHLMPKKNLEVTAERQNAERQPEVPAVSNDQLDESTNDPTYTSPSPNTESKVAAEHHPRHFVTLWCSEEIRPFYLIHPDFTHHVIQIHPNGVDTVVAAAYMEDVLEALKQAWDQIDEGWWIEFASHISTNMKNSELQTYALKNITPEVIAHHLYADNEPSYDYEDIREFHRDLSLTQMHILNDVITSILRQKDTEITHLRNAIQTHQTGLMDLCEEVEDLAEGTQTIHDRLCMVGSQIRNFAKGELGVDEEGGKDVVDQIVMQFRKGIEMYRRNSSVIDDQGAHRIRNVVDDALSEVSCVLDSESQSESDDDVYEESASLTTTTSGVSLTSSEEEDLEDAEVDVEDTDSLNSTDCIDISDSDDGMQSSIAMTATPMSVNPSVPTETPGDLFTVERVIALRVILDKHAQTDKPRDWQSIADECNLLFARTRRNVGIFKVLNGKQAMTAKDMQELDIVDLDAESVSEEAVSISGTADDAQSDRQSTEVFSKASVEWPNVDQVTEEHANEETLCVSSKSSENANNEVEDEESDEQVEVQLDSQFAIVGDKKVRGKQEYNVSSVAPGCTHTAWVSDLWLMAQPNGQELVKKYWAEKMEALEMRKGYGFGRKRRNFEK
ncbi:hypothetical protein HK097_004581 [Rhizophlyctis rosea]|uniref:Ubiquitin-like domain-containing protein n=1 Tax=Rhizophlyctis rosea TaxID=64517 RepID=A0AAD5SDY8_9FUNG|nr:hypothetical protein HK097_004581 [Rhizophlyctis rosea]